MKDFVVNELQKSGLNLKFSADNVFIPCPFHEDKEPSLSVSLGGKTAPGVFNCFGCSASGSWNDLAQKLGLRTVGKSKDDDDVEYRVNNTKIEIFQPIDEEELSLKEIDFKWKSYNPSFLKKFGGKVMWHDKFKDYYLYFPVNYLYEYYGFIRAKIYEDSYGPKYWFNLKKKIPYPIEYIFDFYTPTVTLVEGAADSFRLIKNSIPALSILGVNVTDKMIEVFREADIHTVILCLDNDDAGKRAVLGYRTSGGRLMEGIASILEKEGFNVKVLFPPEEKDPDDMPTSYVKALKYMVQDSGGKLLEEKSNGKNKPRGK